MSIYRLTAKQTQIITTIHAHQQAKEEDIDFDQLLAELPYETSKESMQFSIRALIKKGMVSKGNSVTRRGRSRRTFSITVFGKTMLGLEA
ncbi:hypothetical protein [Vreelandella sulfidaeris]|uniref:MarR family transcriptional regulator n=1 Tax=Vreelandella sulfidaeris TaxID=115553 RepID=A0A455UBL1_9GAMM|nr:hypothetical protein HSBAA_29940 [Halomonas sulfidaeris]